jgi:hypothetical protein
MAYPSGAAFVGVLEDSTGDQIPVVYAGDTMLQLTQFSIVYPPNPQETCNGTPYWRTNNFGTPVLPTMPKTASGWGNQKFALEVGDGFLIVTGFGAISSWPNDSQIIYYYKDASGTCKAGTDPNTPVNAVTLVVSEKIPRVNSHPFNLRVTH